MDDKPTENNIEKILQKIREKSNIRPADGFPEPSPPDSDIPNHLPSQNHDYKKIYDHLGVAEKYSPVGSMLLSMQRYPGIIRWFAKIVGRIILYLTEIITFPQRQYNQSLLVSMRELLKISRELNQNLIIINKKIEEVNKKTEEVNKKTEEVEERITRAWMDEQTKDAKIERGFSQRDNQITELKKTSTYLKTNFAYQERRLSLLLEEARKRLPDKMDKEQLNIFADEEASLLDPLYLFFEDQFRGTREEIKERLKIYIPLLKECDAGTADLPILDAGSGRGEWLELLKKENMIARGVDINRVLVKQNLEKNLDVEQEDIIDYLGSLSDGCLGGITAFHLIEHLPFKVLMKFIDESLRVLVSGGIAIFETPNPENILVGATNFYLDPTHRNPLPSAMMKFFVESRGFCKVEVKKLHPYSDEFKITDPNSELTERFNQYFYGPQDYAIIGYKI